jgi:drug/metabolite transporter (DMT)-like permease
MSVSAKLKAREVDIVLLAVAIVWGASYLAAKVLTTHAPVVVVLSLRFILTALGMFAIWIIKRDSFTRGEIKLGILLGTTQSAILYLETLGVSKTTATNAGLIISLTIVMTPILESIAAKNWLPRAYFVASVVGVVGVLLLVSGNGFGSPGLGDLLMLAAAFVRSIHVTAMGHLTRGHSYSSVNLTLLQNVTGAVVFTSLNLDGVGKAISTFQAPQWWGLLFLSMACSVFAFLGQMWAIRRTSASRASLLLGTEPIWAVAVGVSLGGEILSIIGGIGAVLIVGATFFGQRIETVHRKNNSTNS